METDQTSNHKSHIIRLKKIQSSLLEPTNIHGKDISEVHNNISLTRLQLKVIL